MKADVAVKLSLDDKLPRIKGNPGKLQQVFLNLFLNARDAMPRGGWLTVATRLDGGHVIAEIADTGSGIPSEQLARIYDPFFTTKSIGRGTGLGLSITYGIVREHDGTIHCDSAVGQGTRFTLALPVLILVVLVQNGMAGFSHYHAGDVFPFLGIALIPGLFALLLYYRALDPADKVFLLRHLDSCQSCGLEWDTIRRCLDAATPETVFPRETEVDWREFTRVAVARARAAEAARSATTVTSGRGWFRLAWRARHGAD